MRNHTLIVFAKTPVSGLTKTRLIPRIGAEGAVNLYRAMVMCTLENSMQSGIEAVQLWCAPTIDHPFFQACAQHYNVTLHRQEGADLGERMAHAITVTLHHSRHVILIGTDCPSLTGVTLKHAGMLLNQGINTVITPATDGGYVLLGVTRPSPELFAAISWGSDTVMQSTRERLRNLGARWYEFAEHRDIDRPEDLDYLFSQNLLPDLPDIADTTALLPPSA
jgi:uncharacterized protein